MCRGVVFAAAGRLGGGAAAPNGRHQRVPRVWQPRACLREGVCVYVHGFSTQGRVAQDALAQQQGDTPVAGRTTAAAPAQPSSSSASSGGLRWRLCAPIMSGCGAPAARCAPGFRAREPRQIVT
jgi:hypothetical protein